LNFKKSRGKNDRKRYEIALGENKGAGKKEWAKFGANLLEKEKKGGIRKHPKGTAGSGRDEHKGEEKRKEPPERKGKKQEKGGVSKCRPQDRAGGHETKEGRHSRIGGKRKKTTWLGE